MFLHTYYPQSVLLNLGFIKIYWYGFFIMLGMLGGFFIVQYLLKEYNKIAPGFLRGIDLIDLAFYLIIGGIIGARLGHVLSEYAYYWYNPFNIFKVWNGGMSIYGGVLGGICALMMYKRKIGINFQETIFLMDVLAPGLIIGQAIGRWGNYFNQELYGLPTNLPWGIPIAAANKVEFFSSYNYFHPTFLYESLWCLLVGIILVIMHKIRLNGMRNNSNGEKSAKRGMDKTLGSIFLWYLFLYSGERFIMEFLRVDPVMIIFHMRLMQAIAMIFCLLAIGLMLAKYYVSRKEMNK